MMSSASFLTTSAVAAASSGGMLSHSSSSPSIVRRESILKRSGSVKGESKKNVSIATDLPSVQVISEREQKKGSGGRPASIVFKQEDRPVFKISRSYSFEEDESAAAAEDASPETTRDESQPLV